MIKCEVGMEAFYDVKNSSFISELRKTLSISPPPDIDCETLSKKQLRDLFEMFLLEFSSKATQANKEPECWEYITAILPHLRVLQEVAEGILSLTVVSLAELCMDFISSDSLWEAIVLSVISPEKLLSYCAEKSVAIIVTRLFMLNPTPACAKKILNYVFELKTLIGVDTAFCASMDVVSALLKEFKIKEIDIAEIVVNKIKALLVKVLDMLYMTPVTNLYSVLKLYQAVIDYVNPSHDLCDYMLRSYNILLENMVSVLSQVQWRFLYFKTLKDLLPFSSVIKPSRECIVASQAYIRKVCDCKAFLCNFFSIKVEFAGFVGCIQKDISLPGTELCKGFSKAEIMLFVNGILRATCLICQEPESKQEAVMAEKILLSLLTANCSLENLKVHDIIFDIYFEQDDALIELLLLLLYLHTHTMRNSSTEQNAGNINESLFHPHQMFIELLQRLAFDSSVLLDWLTSNETQFLLYFLKYLKLTAFSFESFHRACSSKDCNTLSSVIFALKELRSRIEKLCSKDLFPYSAQPLLRNIVIIEKLAENH